MVEAANGQHSCERCVRRDQMLRRSSAIQIRAKGIRERFTAHAIGGGLRRGYGCGPRRQGTGPGFRASSNRSKIAGFFRSLLMQIGRHCCGRMTSRSCGGGRGRNIENLAGFRLSGGARKVRGMADQTQTTLEFSPGLPPAYKAFVVLTIVAIKWLYFWARILGVPTADITIKLGASTNG